MGYVVSVDMGTTNVKAVAFDLNGREVFKRSLRFTVNLSSEGWAEQDPEELLNLVLKTVNDCVKAVKGQVEALTFSSQLYSLILVDRWGTCLTPIVNWMDTRSVEEASELSKVIGGYELYLKTGCHLSPIMPVSKVLWFRRRKPGLFRKAFKVLSLKDYVLYKLLGVYVTDKILASATSMFNINKGCWDSEVLEAVGLTLDMLPEVVEPGSIVGEVEGRLSNMTGLPKGVQIICGGGDGMLQNIGFGVLKPGLAASNIGTSGAVRVTSDRVVLDRSRRARFFCHALTGKLWCLGGAINSAGLSIEWFTREFLGGNFRGFEDEAAKAKPGSNGLLFLPYLLGERAPLWCPEAKGVFYGLTISHGLPELSRAVLEGVVFALNHIKTVFEAYVSPIREFRAGGGGVRIELLNQIQADVFQTPVHIASTEEGSALGAAILAATSLGYYKGLEEACRSMVRFTKVFNPDHDNIETYRRAFRTYLRLSETLFRGFFKPQPF